MTTYYLDSNILLYLVTQKSVHYPDCKTFLDRALAKNIPLATSTETLQEVIHVSSRLGYRKQGIALCKLILEDAFTVLSIDEAVIQLFLSLAKNYPKADSRDLVHLAACVTHKIDTIATYDKGFKKFKEITARSPEDFS